MKKTAMLCAAMLVSGFVFAQKKTEKVNVPAAVQAAFAKQFPSAKSVEWSMESKTEYEAEFKNGAFEQAANFDASGKWVVTETEIKKADLPAAVTKVIAKDFAGYKTEEVEKVEKPGSVYYELKVEKGETSYVVEVSPEGKVLKKQQEKEEKKG